MAEEGYVGKLEDNLEVGALLLLVWVLGTNLRCSSCWLEYIILVTGCLSKERWQFMVSFLDRKTKTIMSDPWTLSIKPVM